MIDPRFEEVLEFIDERDEDGMPSVRAKIAIKIQAYAQDVDNLRKELSEIEEGVTELQVSVDAMEIAIEEQASHKVDLVTEAQDAAVRAAMSGSGAGAARLRKIAQTTRDRIDEFTKDFDEESNRLSQAKISLEAKKQAVKDKRDMIVRRLNTMSSLADRAGVEFGTEIFEDQQSSQPKARRAAPPRMMRRRPRRVRVRRRRAS